VGFAGWRSKIAKVIFSLNGNATRQVELNGKRLALGSTTASMAAGLGFAPEDRNRQGLALDLPIRAEREPCHS
jgi:ABC-type sugar transport system ATPase subunit